MATKIIIVGHGTLALAFIDSIAMLAGAVDDTEVVGIEFSVDDSRDTLQEKIAAELIKFTGENNHVIICCDMLGGSPFNASYLLSQQYKFSIITGMNLPLLMELILTKDSYETKEQLIELAEMTKDSIKVI